MKKTCLLTRYIFLSCLWLVIGSRSAAVQLSSEFLVCTVDLTARRPAYMPKGLRRRNLPTISTLHLISDITSRDPSRPYKPP
jgi:hypothetical protein